MIENKQNYNIFSEYIKISVIPSFIEHESSPTDRRYIWSYQIRIENKNQATVQLWRRTWKITDSVGKVYEVTGEGVVGEQPVIKAGQVFEYTSATSLSSPSGIMEGFYEMKDSEGYTFHVKIPTFSLDSPYESRMIN